MSETQKLLSVNIPDDANDKKKDEHTTAEHPWWRATLMYLCGITCVVVAGLCAVGAVVGHVGIAALLDQGKN